MIDEAIGKGWHVVYTNPKCEDRAASGLIDKGFGVYVPRYLEERAVRRTRVKRLVRLNLFPRYVFVLAPYGSWPQITSTDGVAALLKEQGFIGKPLYVPFSVIEELQHRQAIGAFDRIGPKKRPRRKSKPIYDEGTKVQIVDGPFQSFYATVVSALSGYDAEILIDIFGRMTSVRVGLDDIKALA